jgi:DNA invertase Pin-like site-specific DNA recombinase
MLDFHMLGAIAKFERALIRERAAAGLAEARSKVRQADAQSDSLRRT